jgi:hypothetical protein
MQRDGDDLIFTTDVGDTVRANPENPITVDTDPATGEPAPRIHIRRGLEARIARTVFYDLVEIAEERDGQLAVSSGGVWFPLGPPGAGLA